MNGAAGSHARSEDTALDAIAQAVAAEPTSVIQETNRPPASRGPADTLPPRGDARGRRERGCPSGGPHVLPLLVWSA